jgi:apolipoprotein D and lipocalin family protein
LRGRGFVAAACYKVDERLLSIKILPLRGGLRRSGSVSARLALTILCLMLGACGGLDSRGELTTVTSVDLSRYAGTWYEIARLPMWFQRHCVDSKAIYSSRPDGAILVHNECVTNTGEVEQAEGVATVVDAKTNARLTVIFDNWFARLFGSSREGNYWILDLDPEYRTAMVGTPDRRYLWILSRTPQFDEAMYRRLVERAQQLGYPVSDLIRARHPASS